MKVFAVWVKDGAAHVADFEAADVTAKRASVEHRLWLRVPFYKRVLPFGLASLIEGAECEGVGFGTTVESAARALVAELERRSADLERAAAIARADAAALAEVAK